jgi:hypothetical protein
MSVVDQSKVLQFAKLAMAAGWEWCGYQESIPPLLPELVVQRKYAGALRIPFDPADFEPETLAKLHLFRQERKMATTLSLKEKLHTIYEMLDHIDKAGHNKAQNYDYIQAADVTRAIRSQLIEQRIYAEVNFDFVGGPFTIARAKEPTAPFTAVLVKCSVVFHDLDSDAVLTGSGLGTGADTGDKAAYKAQTGAFKYALKNSCMVPDEADPEADENIDEGGRSNRDEEPDFQDAKRQRDRQEQVRQPKQDARPTQTPPSQDGATSAAGKSANVSKSNPPAEPPPTEARSTKLQDSAPSAKPADAPSTTLDVLDAEPEKGDAFEGPDEDRMPTEAELDTYRKAFNALGNDLADKGKLKASKNLPAPVKLRVFLLSITGANSPKEMTNSQWIDFFNRVDKAVGLETGYVGLAKLVNKANGIEDK